MAPPIPPLEDRVKVVIDETKLDADDILQLWKVSLRYDRAQSGFITQDQFHEIIKDEELLFFFGMCLFDLVDCRNYKGIATCICFMGSN